MNITEILNIFISGAVTIIVAIIGYKQQQKTKKDDEYRELQEELEKERAILAKKEKDASEERLSRIENTLNGLSHDVDKLKDCVETLTTEQIIDIKKQLQTLHAMESNTFTYVGSLSNVVSTIGETMTDYTTIVDAEAREHLEEAIQEHKKAELEIHSQLYKLIM